MNINKLKKYLDCFNCSSLQTIRNLIKLRKYTIEDVASLMETNERTLRRILSGEYELNKKRLSLICAALQLPFRITIELFYIAKIILNTSDLDLELFEILNNLDANEIYENIEKIKKLF